MGTPPIQYSGPVVAADVPWEVRRHLQLIYQKLGNHTQAFQLLNAKTTETTTPASGAAEIAGVGGGGTGSQSFPQNSVIIGNGSAPLTSVSPVRANYLLTDNGPSSIPSFQLAAWSEPLTDGNSNFIFAAGDIVVVTGLRA